MGSSNRWDRTNKKGQNDRIITCNYLNPLLEPIRLIILPFHEHVKTMGFPEKFLKNTLKNRMTKVGLTEAMGHDYVIQGLDNPDIYQPVYIRYSNDANTFIKVSSDMKDRPEEFLDIVKDWWFLWAGRTKKDSKVLNIYSDVITVGAVIKECGWKMETSSTNETKLSIPYHPKMQRGPTDPDFWGNTFLTDLLDKLL